MTILGVSGLTKRFGANPVIVTVPDSRELSHVYGHVDTPPTTAHQVCLRF